MKTRKTTKRPTVYVLSIEHRNGEGCSTHKTEAGALAAAYQYVKDNWADGMSTDESIPTDHYDAVEAYFHEHDREFYRIETCTLED